MTARSLALAHQRAACMVLAQLASSCRKDAVNIHLAPPPNDPMPDSMTWYYRMFGELVCPIPVQRYDDEGHPVVTNEKAADLAIVRLQLTIWHGKQ